MRGLWIWLGLAAPTAQIEEAPLGPEAELEARADALRVDLQEVDDQLAAAWEWGDVEEALCVRARRDAIRALLGEVETASVELSVYEPHDPRVESALRRTLLAEERAQELLAEVSRCGGICCLCGDVTVRVDQPDDDLAREVAHHPESIERHRW